jgi:hypothetical protein
MSDGGKNSEWKGTKGARMTKEKKSRGGWGGKEGGRRFHQRKQEEKERDQGPLPVTGWISGIALRIRNMPS